MLKMKVERHIPRESHGYTGGCFECNMYCIKALDWLKKEEQEKKEDEQF